MHIVYLNPSKTVYGKALVDRLHKFLSALKDQTPQKDFRVDGICKVLDTLDCGSSRFKIFMKKRKKYLLDLNDFRMFLPLGSEVDQGPFVVPSTFIL